MIAEARALPVRPSHDDIPTEILHHGISTHVGAAKRASVWVLIMPPEHAFGEQLRPVLKLTRVPVRADGEQAAVPQIKSGRTSKTVTGIGTKVVT